MGIKDRFIIYLKAKSIGRTAFEESAGLSRGTISQKSGFSANSVEKIALACPDLNLDWLITGKGEMLKTDSYHNNDSGITYVSKPQDIYSKKSDNTLAYPEKPYIDSVYAICGKPNGFSVAVKENECDRLSLPFMNDYDFSIQAKGDSMINRLNPQRSIREGDIVACRLWKSRSHIRWGEVYALATSEGVIIKKIKESDKEGHIKCVSFNTEDGFTPYDLPVEEIHDWAIVVGVVSVQNWN